MDKQNEIQSNIVNIKNAVEPSLECIDMNTFLNLINAGRWERFTDYEIIEEDDAGYVTGWIARRSVLTIDTDLEFGITYIEHFEYLKYQPESLCINLSLDSMFEFTGFYVCDEQKRRYHHDTLFDLIPDKFRWIDYLNTLPIGRLIDYDPGSIPRHSVITLTMDTLPDMKFHGVLLTTVSDSPQEGHERYSGRVGEWTVFEVYRLTNGRYVCRIIQRSQWAGQSEGFRGRVCMTKDCIKKFFGNGWLANDLYKRLGI